MKAVAYRKLVAAGFTPDQIALVMEAEEAEAAVKADKVREQTRLRVAKHRAGNALHALHVRTDDEKPNQINQINGEDCNALQALPLPPLQVPPPAPPLPNPSIPIPPTPLGGGTPQKNATLDNSAFGAWWALYPNKVGKADARRKFDIARRSVPIEALMAGLQAYVAKTDDRPWCNPSTWLHQGRWEDQPPVAIAAVPRRSLYVSADEQRAAEHRRILQSYIEGTNGQSVGNSH